MTSKPRRRLASTREITRPKPENPSGRVQESYQELRRIAHHIRRERADQTLETTELVHEAYIRLTEHGPDKYSTPGHFFGSVSRAMRTTLTDRSRKRHAQKRGRDWQRMSLDDVNPAGVPVPDFQALHEAVSRLNAFDSGLGRIVELRFFDGFSTDEMAKVLRRGKSTIRRDWAIAKAWLQRELACTER